MLRRARSQDIRDSRALAGISPSHILTRNGYKLEGSKLTLSKIGTIRIFKHREVEGKIKTCTIKKDLLGHWYAVLVAEIEDIPSVEPKLLSVWMLA